MTTYMTADDIGKRLAVKGTTIRKWARQGLIPSVRLTGRVLRFDPDAVDEALRERAIGAKGEPSDAVHHENPEQ